MEKLGSGTSLPGILAAKCGGDVTLSDSEDFPHCLENCRKSCQANGLPDIPVIGITWGRFNDVLLHLSPVDVILGSDCFYDSKGWTLSLSSLSLFLPTLTLLPLSLLPSLTFLSLSFSSLTFLPVSFSPLSHTLILICLICRIEFLKKISLIIFIDFEDIVVTVSYLIKQNSEAEFWCTYQERR